MTLRFLGANRQVTGSCHYLKTGGARLLVDCGMFQERAYLSRNWEPSSLRPKNLDALFLTHAHIDHCGLVPKLVREGFRGPIHATHASAELIKILLEDAARIQVEDAAYKKKRHRKEGRRGKHPIVPLFTEKDVRRTLPLIRPVHYGEEVKVNDHATVKFYDAGHILGSAMLEVDVRTGNGMRRLVFSGDIGQRDRPIVRDPSVFAEADYIIVESTYGDREHGDKEEDVEVRLADVIVRTVEAGGNLVIPIFAIERAQEMVYHIARLVSARKIPPVPVYLDSPMAARATEVFRRHRECFDDDAWHLINSGHSPLRFDGLRVVESVEESKDINRLKEPVIIMATSGMCTAGRIKHHLAHNISKSESTILFVGYQAEGTLGRQIVSGSPRVRIHGHDHEVRASVEEIHGFSGHADGPALMHWLSHFKKPPRHVFVTHGEEKASLALADNIRRDFGWDVSVPEYQESFVMGELGVEG
ncbi:MAG: MBL fold metallo-hydrolase [Pirellulales bacterium]|nr:MBL fold metallo-hydrolase [Pirellulales bacterium]